MKKYNWRRNLAEKRHSASNCENGFTAIVTGAGESVPDAGNRGKEKSSCEVQRMSEREGLFGRQ